MIHMMYILYTEIYNLHVKFTIWIGTKYTQVSYQSSNGGGREARGSQDPENTNLETAP